MKPSERDVLRQIGDLRDKAEQASAAGKSDEADRLRKQVRDLRIKHGLVEGTAIKTEDIDP